MDSNKITQGTLVLVGTGAVSTGIGFMGNGRPWEGLLLVAVGVALVFWREQRKRP